jgi:hypothetical protein
MKTQAAFIGIICLALGFSGGWLVRSQWSEPAEGSTGRVASPATLKPATTPPGFRSEPARDLREPLDPAKTQRLQTALRLSILAGEKKRGLQINVPVFSFGNEGIDPTFARVYDLNPGEIAVLNEAIKATKEKFTAAAIQNAKAQLSPDGSHLAVEVPPVVDQGGVIYDQLLQTVENVLGPDRFQSFNALSGDTFDSGFGSFGLWSSRYELAATEQKIGKGVPIYRVLVTSKGPNGSSTSDNSITLKSIPTLYPVLNHFIPPGFDSASGHK